MSAWRLEKPGVSPYGVVAPRRLAFRSPRVCGTLTGFARDATNPESYLPGPDDRCRRCRSALAEAEGEFVTYPGSPFQLFRPYPPAGDQPTAIASLGEGIDDGLAFQTLLGVTGSGKTFTMANVIARMGRPAIVFAPNKTLAAQLYSEFREFFPKNAVEYFVSYYDYYQPEAYVPQRDLFIEKDSSINEHIEQMRLSATKSVLERRDVIIAPCRPSTASASPRTTRRCASSCATATSSGSATSSRS